jgi:hypothetical protein
MIDCPCTCPQVYDEDSERYITFDEAEARLAPAQPLAA